VSRDGAKRANSPRSASHARGVASAPDSTALAFVADTHQRDEYSYDRADLFTITTAGTLTRLTDDGFDSRRHRCGATAGDAIFALREQSLNQILAAKQSAGSATDLYRFPAAGGQPKDLTADWDFIPGSPQVSADGRFVYFTAGRAGTTHLYRVNSNGGAVEQVTNGDRPALRHFDRLEQRPDCLQRHECHRTRGGVQRQPRWQRREDPDARQRRLHALGRSPAGGAVAIHQQGWQRPVDGWIMMPASAASGTRVPMVLFDARRPARGVRHRIQLLFSVEWLRTGWPCSMPTPRVNGVRREVPLGNVGRLGRRGLRGSVGRRGLRGRALPRRPEAAGRDGLFVWRIPDQLGDHADAAVRRGNHRAGISNWISDYGTADIPRTKESEFYGAPWEARVPRHCSMVAR
jgi:hypothetical protein